MDYSELHQNKNALFDEHVYHYTEEPLSEFLLRYAGKIIHLLRSFISPQMLQIPSEQAEIIFIFVF